MKKRVSRFFVAIMAASLFSGCAASAKANTDTGQADSFKLDQEIKVVSREDGSGTRGAFIELFGIEVKGDNGSKKDMTTKEAVIANKTDIMITGITSDEYAIGYISLGSLNDTVKALKIDSVSASAENVKNGTYTACRPFNIAVKSEISVLAKDFIDFIMSSDGQAVVAKSYVAIDDRAPAYAGSKPGGKIVVAGSSSVTPIMEKLQEAYQEINPNATIEIQMSDSTTGITGAIDGTCDIGMASRDLKDSELESLTAVEIALDGIAVIVNNDNPVSDMTKEDIRKIFTGEVTTWGEI